MSSRAVVIVITLVIVGLTLVSMRDFFTKAPEPEAPAPVIQRILVAKRNLPSGSFIQVQQDFEWQALPDSEKDKKPDNNDKKEAGDIKPEYQYEGAVNPDEFNGAVVRRSIRAGEPIIPSLLMKSGEGGFMSAVLEPGKRAVSISVNPTSGNAGFVSPGDRVDLLITYHASKEQSSGKGSITTETFVNNVRVLAVDQNLENPENKALLAKTITVEVSPDEAEKISVAAEMGKISVALVSTAIPDSGVIDSSDAMKKPSSGERAYTIDGDVGSLISSQERATKKVKIIRGGEVETLEFYQDEK